MTLQKVVSIKNTGRFHNCTASGDTALSKYTLAFAENGRGKTTLCAILRSLGSGDSAYIAGRKTLGQDAPPEVNMLLSDGLATFRNNAWNKLLPKIAVFDGTFISENVHAGDTVDTEQRRSLYKVIIGADGVALAREVSELDVAIREKNVTVAEARARIEGRVPDGLGLDAFLGMDQDPDIDAKVDAAENDLEAVKKVDRLQASPGLSQIELPALPTGIHETLSKTIDGVAADAEKLISDHLLKHQMGDRGEPWLNEGLSFIAEGECAFCSQNLKDVALIDAYKAYFSDAYRSLKADIGANKRQIEQSFAERAVGAFERTIENNENTVAFWKDYCDFDVPGFVSSIDEVRRAIEALRDAVLTILNKKETTPLDKISTDEAYVAAVKGYKALLGEMRVYNAKIDVANATIEERKKEARAADIVMVEKTLAQLRAHKARHTGQVVAEIGRYQKLVAEKSELTKRKSDAKEKLDAHTEAVIKAYGDGINRYLDRFNAGFSISHPTHDYRGRTPSTSYDIVINETAIALGAPGTPLSEPCFKNTLSSGDRSTLALAFFFAQLEHDPERAEKLVVLDDPFTSQDTFRRTQTAMEIRRCGEQSAQLLLLSHDPYFLKLVWDMLAPAERKGLQLARVGEKNTAIAEWDIDEAVKARYRADVDCLQRYYSDGIGDTRDVVQKIRPVLEGYCRNLYPAQFDDNDTLGAILGKIRAGGNAHPLVLIADDLDDLNEYTKRYHHGENPNAATEAINDAELGGYVKRTLKTVGNLI